MKLLILIILISLSLSSCYNYEGPMRAKKVIPKPKLRVLKVKPKLSAQQYLEKMAGDIAKAIPSAQVTILEDSIKVLFPDNIKYSQSAILPIKSINTEIKKLAKLINQYDKTNVLITGHTDKSGDEQENKRLSDLRAKYIADLLIAYKAPKDRINAWGIGSVSPIASELTEGGQERNRRVEFVVLSTIEDEEEL